jgi:hypothetical protein
MVSGLGPSLLQKKEFLLDNLGRQMATIVKAPVKWMEEFSKRMLEDRILSKQAYIIRTNTLKALFTRALSIGR